MSQSVKKIRTSASWDSSSRHSIVSERMEPNFAEFDEYHSTEIMRIKGIAREVRGKRARTRIPAEE